MRMNQTQELDAFKLINEYDESALSDVFFNYGELRNAKILARNIVLARSEKPIVTTQDLITVVRPLVSERIENKILDRKSVV